MLLNGSRKLSLRSRFTSIECEPFASILNSGTGGMYFGGFDNKSFFSFLSHLQCDYAFSYDGISGSQNMVSEVPKNLFKKHVMIENGNSSFKRVVGNDKNATVHESLYLNFEPEFDLLLF